MKLSSRDLLSILRRFDVADESALPRHIEHLKITQLASHTTIVSARFNKQLFYIIVDNTAEDDPGYIVSQVKQIASSVEGEVIANPNDHLTSYALPFKGKDAYVFAALAQKKRLDAYLAEQHPNTSRSTWQKHIKAGHVSVNGAVQTSPKQAITDADSVAIALPPVVDFSGRTLPVIHLDDYVIAVDKPAGILTHAKGALSDEFTVADFFRNYTSWGLDTNRPGIVHRLDRDTSGVIIGARTPEAAKLLQKQFSERTVKKRYIAIANGVLKEKRAVIELPIDRHPSSPSTFRVDAKGKPATTSYQVLAEKDGLSLVELRPLTGRTHQLRVHMQYLGAPILGDRVYGVAADRLYLHAQSLEITVPTSLRKVFTSPLPAEFASHFPEYTP